METRPGCRVNAIIVIVTSCHGNDDEAWSTSCLIMQHKPYTVNSLLTDAANSGLTRYSGHSSMHGLISLYYCTKITPD